MEQNQFPEGLLIGLHDLRWRACSNSPVDLDLCTHPYRHLPVKPHITCITHDHVDRHMTHISTPPLLALKSLNATNNVACLAIHITLLYLPA